MNVTALLTRFAHHKPDGGYKRVITELQALGVHFNEFGNDETDPGFPRGFWDQQQQAYKWIAEWRAARAKRPTDLVHVLYGEEYFRFTPWLFRNTPLVATFHQPAELLARELTTGDHGGRIAAWTHRLTRARFNHLDAAIVTNPAQRPVLAEHMPADRIHVIPLGVDLPAVDAAEVDAAGRSGVITLGNWLRDWDTFEAVVRALPHVDFTLINRNLEPSLRARFAAITNLQYLPGISEEGLMKELLSARAAFLPLKQLAGSNALLECLAAGLPVVMSDASAEVWRGYEPQIRLFPVGDAEAGAKAVGDALAGFGLAEKAREIAKQYAWPAVARRTWEIYQSIA